MSTASTWDIFCAVIDNYGDIGVCWRLARQLVAEHGLHVRLWVDDLASLQKLCPEISPLHDDQMFRGVEIRCWADPFPEVHPADVVIEAFACELPESYVRAMAMAPSYQPSFAGRVWINLEYLSAEHWVADCHGMTSLHPSLPLTKYFFFPGFAPSTGGLIREKSLGEGFDTAMFWHERGLLPPQEGELRISLFGYENAAVGSLLGAWAESPVPITCLLPEGRLTAQVEGWLGKRADAAVRGNLTVRALPFLEQDAYDRLLWACDVNFVRGEDSFVRAQWAAKPFVWHIYQQAADAHLPKLEAFLDLYCKGLASDAADAMRAFWHAWNRGENAGDLWPEFWVHRTALEQHARAWRASLIPQGDLASRLVNFCKNKV